MSPGSAYVLMHHWIGEIDGHAGAWGWVHGGMGAVSRSLADAARAAGAEVRTDSPVHRVVIRDGRAVGVELTDGVTLGARRIISSAHPTTTYLDLIGEADLPEEATRDIKRFRTRSGSVKVNLGLRDLPRPKAWEGDLPGDPHTGIMSISPSIEYLERAWDDAKYGRMSADPYIEAVFPTVFEPGVAPENKHVALCFTQFGPFELKDGSWDDGGSDEYGRNVVRVLDEHCPGFAESVEHIEVSATARDRATLRFARWQHHARRDDARPDVLFPADPRVRRLSHADQGSLYVWCGNTSRWRSDGGTGSQRGAGRSQGRKACHERSNACARSRGENDRRVLTE